MNECTNPSLQVVTCKAARLYNIFNSPKKKNKMHLPNFSVVTSLR